MSELTERLKEVIERTMTEHWDMAACRCDLCEAGRDAGCAPRECYLPHIGAKATKEDKR